MHTLTKQEVMEGTSREVRWWLNERLKKFRQLDHATMAINPFMAPVIMALHSHMSFKELGELLLDGHFMTGHATGFGKLVDEKLVPRLFGTTKLAKQFRKINTTYLDSCFDNVDHVIGCGTSDQILMSIKASRWTIQLGQAVNLNHSFTKLLTMREQGEVAFSRIVVGVFYGTQDSLTDKFDIIRGICSGAAHDVTDISEEVAVVAGREFWSWINGGQPETQEWILEGTIDAIVKSQQDLSDAKSLLDGYKGSFENSLKHHVRDDGTIDWKGLLKEING